MDQNINYDSNRVRNSADFVLIFCEKLPNTNYIVYKENSLLDFLIYTFDNIYASVVAPKDYVCLWTLKETKQVLNDLLDEKWGTRLEDSSKRFLG